MSFMIFCMYFRPFSLTLWMLTLALVMAGSIFFVIIYNLYRMWVKLLSSKNLFSIHFQYLNSYDFGNVQPRVTSSEIVLRVFGSVLEAEPIPWFKGWSSGKVMGSYHLIHACYTDLTTMDGSVQLFHILCLPEPTTMNCSEQPFSK